MKSCYEKTGYVLDPHSAVGIAAAKRSIARTGPHILHISMATAHPAKFAEAVKLALKHEDSFDFEKTVLPRELDELTQMEKRVTVVENSWEAVREIVKKQVVEDMR